MKQLFEFDAHIIVEAESAAEAADKILEGCLHYDLAVSLYVPGANTATVSFVDEPNKAPGS